MELAIRISPDEELVLLRNEARFNLCNWETADQREEIVEHTFEDIADEVLHEATESRLLARFKSAEDAELVTTMFTILQRAVQETGLR